MSVLITGTGRSGTTWLANIINYDETYRYTFEPFHPDKNKNVKHFGYRKYLRPDCNDEQFTKPLMNIFNGKNQLIKCIRVSFLLSWLYRNIPDLKIVMLVRYPCAVAYSRLKMGWDSHLEEIISQDELVEDFLDPFMYLVKEVKSDFEKHVLLWCFENYVAINALKYDNFKRFMIFRYENLVSEPKRWIDNIFKYLNKAYDERVFDMIGKPSATCRKDSAINVPGRHLVYDWKNYVDYRQEQRANELLKVFKLEKLMV